MTARELWRNIMNYGEFDRMPVIHWEGWDETRERWIQESMPADADEHGYLDAVPYFAWIGANTGLYPWFDEEVVEETEEYCIFRDQWGALKKDWKHKSTVPHFIEYPLKTAKDWDEYKKRLQPDPGRIPEDLDAQIEKADSSGLPITLWTNSLVGYIRTWFGVINFSYLMYDAPDVFADIVMTLADLACWSIDQIMPRMKTKPECGFGHEDICGKNGPLIRPELFRRYIVPGYLRIRNKLEEYGITIFGTDCDGYIEPIVQDWLDGGVNLMFPVEIGTWNADPMELRKKFGKELRMVGGFNKMVLEKGPAEIDAEIERRIPLMREGGYIMMPDHLITPGTSLENYRYYLDRVRNLRL